MAQACNLWLVSGVFDKGKAPPKQAQTLRTVIWDLGVQNSDGTFRTVRIDIDDAAPTHYLGVDASKFDVAVLKISVNTVTMPDTALEYVKNDLKWFVDQAHFVTIHPVTVTVSNDAAPPQGYFCRPQV